MFQDVMAGNKEQQALDDLAALWNAELQKSQN